MWYIQESAGRKMVALVAVVSVAGKVQAGNPIQANAAPCAPNGGFLNFQNLGFLIPPAPSTAYVPPARPGCFAGGSTGLKPNTAAGAQRAFRRGFGAGVYPYAFGYGFAAPYFYVTPGDYTYAYGYSPSAPAGANQPPAGDGNAPGALWLPPARADAAEITVNVPPDAEVWIEGVKMQQRGSVRLFVSPRLRADMAYAYEIRAAWTEGERTVQQKQEISVRAGDRLSLTFVPRPPQRAEAVPARAP